MSDGAGAIGVEFFFVAVSVLAYLVFMGYPLRRILERLGFDVGPRMLSLAGFTLVPVLALWFFAFAHWPVGDTADRRRLAG